MNTKKIALFLLIAIVSIAIVFVACEGPMGPPGPSGEQGEQGPPGQDGQDGADAVIPVYWGELSEPPSGANPGDIYRDSDGWIYILTTDGWEPFVRDGQDGQDGEDGAQVLAVLQANEMYTPVVGYHYAINNYTPPVDAYALVYARMSADSNQAGDQFSFRIAFRTPSETGTNQVGNSFYLDVHTTEPNRSVFQSNFDNIDIVAGQSYDFGVHFVAAAATTGSQFDWLSMLVLILERE